jgi:predicted enzyme related to lactoylglutathione lyase
MTKPVTDTVRFECSTPILRVENMTAALDFYVGLLGFKKADWSTGDFASVNRDRAGIYLAHADQGRGQAWVWLGVEDVRKLHEEFAARGVKMLRPPTNYSWALEMQIEDPDGNVLRFGSDPE